MKKRILIVEDEVTILQLLTMVLAKEGYEVHTCQTGRDAIARIRERWNVIFEVLEAFHTGYRRVSAFLRRLLW